MNRDEKFILTITAGSHLSVHCFMLVFPSILLVLKNEFSVGLDVLGFIATLSALMFGIGAIPSGYFESKVGGRVLLLIYQAGTIVATMLIVMSQSLWMLATGLALLGLFCSIYHPAGLTLISRRISNISKGMALHGIAGSLGLALAPVIAASFTTLFSWRAAFGFLAFVNFVLAFFTFFLVPKMKKKIVEEDHSNTKVTNKMALILYYSIGIFMGITFAGFTTFLPTHFALQTVEWAGSPTLRGGILTTLVLLSGIIGQLLGGYFGSRFDKAYLLFIIVVLNVPFLALIGLTPGMMMIFSGIIFSIVHFSMQPIGNSLIAQITQSNHRGVGYGISFFFSFGVGGFGAGIGGLIAEHFGVAKIFPAMSIILIPAIGLAWLLKKRV